MTKFYKKIIIKRLTIKLVIIFKKMRQKIIYGLCALIVAAIICQDDILVLLPSASSERIVKEETVAPTGRKKTAASKVETTEIAACDQGTVYIDEVIDVVCEPVKKNNRRTNKQYSRSEVVRLNGKTYQKLEDKLLACVAYVENYSPQSYFCGAKWTIGYGSTGYANGERVYPGQTITQEEAKACVRAHFRRYVFPIIDKYVERELNENEMLATCLFIYNIGGGNFTKDGGSCAFLTALNNNADAEECARKMTEFYRSAGKKSSGLLKRRWVEGALFCGYITAEDIMELTPAGFYNADLSEYYASRNQDKDGFYSYNLSEETVNRFLEKNKGTRSVSDII